MNILKSITLKEVLEEEKFLTNSKSCGKKVCELNCT